MSGALEAHFQFSKPEESALILNLRPLYAAPPQAQPDHFAGDGNMVQPLTYEQIEDIWIKHGLNECDCHGFARAIEQAHGIGERP